jgi:hypothetical protein
MAAVGVAARAPAVPFVGVSTWRTCRISCRTTPVCQFRKMTIAVDLKYADGRMETHEVPVGSLPPCRQVGITDGGYFRKLGLAGSVRDVVTYVYFVDPTGHKWKRYVGQETDRSPNHPQDRP